MPTSEHKQQDARREERIRREREVRAAAEAASRRSRLEAENAEAGLHPDWPIPPKGPFESVRRLDVEPGDVLVFQCERRVPRDVFIKLRDQLRERFAEMNPPVQLIVLEAGLKLEAVVRSEDSIEQQAGAPVPLPE